MQFLVLPPTAPRFLQGTLRAHASCWVSRRGQHYFPIAKTSQLDWHKVPQGHPARKHLKAEIDHCLDQIKDSPAAREFIEEFLPQGQGFHEWLQRQVVKFWRSRYSGPTCRPSSNEYTCLGLFSDVLKAAGYILRGPARLDLATNVLTVMRFETGDDQPVQVWQQVKDQEAEPILVPSGAILLFAGHDVMHHVAIPPATGVSMLREQLLLTGSKIVHCLGCMRPRCHARGDNAQLREAGED